jgi:hypothetical protein
VTAAREERRPEDGPALTAPCGAADTAWEREHAAALDAERLAALGERLVAEMRRDARAALLLTRRELLALLDPDNAQPGETEAAERKLLEALAALSQREYDAQAHPIDPEDVRID